ncbi:sulfopyruvate decarboxylase subunit alpha [Candidatus Methanocrinis natronophilus]|uniref:sulfopyruvate decarboxylase n=1 Tax=Candidatus Methanocrinis natronophilus TaxID=3033396 RepID=A0ABT5X759_9EURY|nr:sulfopyruvate decarboxylase subunit alpha [Candidatus Methanocrinis natronophilus]MDF0590527.1 sulfopyruvate decarboxylase subunit alpha [Candidatus Methanocrinis natronophilus]
MKEMSPSEAVYNGMKGAGIDFVVSVPCVNLQELIHLVDLDPKIGHVPVTREEEGVGIAAGAYMGGKRAALLMQNSGLGNSINALASLNGLYKIPLLMIISHRGGEGETIAGQVPMGRLTPKLLDVMDIPRFSPSPEEAEEIVARAWELAHGGRTPTAVLLDIEFWRSLR